MISEFNRYTTADFASRPEDLETPAVFTEIGSIYANSAQQGIDSMYAFKFSQTVNNGTAYETGFHYVENGGTYDITGATHAAGVVRLFAKGFKDARPMLAAATTTNDASYDFVASFDASSGNYFGYAVNRNSAESYTATIDLGDWNVAPGTVISIEEVSGLHNGEVTHLVTVPENRQITLTQPSQSVWLLTVPSGQPQSIVTLVPTADAGVRNSDAGSTSDYREQNFGDAAGAMVGRDPNSAELDRALYLQFALGDLTASDVSRAILELTGMSSADPISLHVYALANDAWGEDTITWANAPNLLAGDAKITGVGTTAFPVGILTFGAGESTWGIDITPFLSGHGDLLDDGLLTFALVREERFAGDVDAAQSYVQFFTRESAFSPQLLLFVPEPSSAALLAVAATVLLGLASIRQRRVTR